jgi:DNA-binding CsgD family transcriptional regulator
MRRSRVKQSRVGVLLVDSQLRPMHYNDEALNILGYPEKARQLQSLEDVLPLTSQQLARLNEPGSRSEIEFTSGRRRYICRAFLLSGERIADRIQPWLVLMLERESVQPVDITRWSEEHQLTNRECETVRLLLMGLSSKEIASQMSISPSTVKTFLKLVMAKVGATSRTGIVAKIVKENQQRFAG